MPTILDAIVATKKEEVRRLRSDGLLHGGRTSHKRPFIEAIAKAQGLGIIAEVKKASPSRGIIAASFDPIVIAKAYEKGGAIALSVLTDEKYFQGAPRYLEAVRDNVSLPVLRKDFIIDPLQVEQTSAINADAMLLIAAIVSDSQMQELYSAAKELSIDPLIEVHTAKECERVLKVSPLPSVIGINNRDLQTFETDINVTLEILKIVPKEIMVISESGIHTKEQAKTLFNAGVKGLLIGESLMRSEDPGKMIGELRELK
jgi:indole-3-glycerol phosphate synthase